MRDWVVAGLREEQLLRPRRAARAGRWGPRVATLLVAGEEFAEAGRSNRGGTSTARRGAPPTGMGACGRRRGLVPAAIPAAGEGRPPLTGISPEKVEHPDAPLTEVEPPILEASPKAARPPSSVPPRTSAGEEPARVSRSLDERRRRSPRPRRRRVAPHKLAEAEARLVAEREALAAAVAACDSREHALAQAEEALNMRTQALGRERSRAGRSASRAR